MCEGHLVGFLEQSVHSQYIYTLEPVPTPTKSVIVKLTSFFSLSLVMLRGSLSSCTLVDTCSTYTCSSLLNLGHHSNSHTVEFSSASNLVFHACCCIDIALCSVEWVFRSHPSMHVSRLASGWRNGAVA